MFGRTGEIRGDVDGLSFNGSLEDLRSDLATAHLLESAEKKARLIAPPLGSEALSSCGGGVSLPGEKALREGLLRLLFNPGDTDTFDVFCWSLQDRLHDWRDDSATWRRALALLLEKEGLTAAARQSLQQILWSRERPSKRWDLAACEQISHWDLPGAALTPAWEMEDALALTSLSLGRKISALEEPQPALPLDRGGKAVAKSLARPRQVPFIERALPKEFISAPLDESEQVRWEETLEKRAESFGLPDGYEPVRLQRDSNRLLAVTVSQDYDPTGEVSMGGYWVLRSEDGGRTWLPPRYTGLRMYAPYHIRPDSRLPLIAGDRLQLEVEVKELDEESVTFPPVGLRLKNDRGSLILDFPLAEMDRDTDGDGLTDLAEERLMTDIEDPDTDGDGIRDFDDPLPQIAESRSSSSESGALAASLNAIFSHGSAAIIEPIRDPDHSQAEITGGWKRPAHSEDRTLFLVGRRPDFSALFSPRRIIVLDNDEADRMDAKFGPSYPVRFTEFFFDRARERAFVEWSAGWVGGTLLLVRNAEGWTCYTLSSWIT